MYHSITFGDKNTWDDWHLIPASRPAVAIPDVRTKYVEIPGRHGSVDIGDILTGFPVYGDRSGSFSFYVENGHWPWHVAYSTIANYLHGKQMNMILEDDPGYYYQGRFKVGTWQTGKQCSGIEISYIVGSFKIAVNSSAEDWLWDPFNFETGIIRDYRNISVSGTKNVTVIGAGQPTVPKFTVTGSITATLRGSEYVLPVGTDKEIYGFYINPGDNVITFRGNGTVTIDYREVSL